MTRLLEPYDTPPDWSYLGSLKSLRTGRSRRKEAAQERKEPQADQSFPRRNRMGTYLFGLCHPPRIELCSEVCFLRLLTCAPPFKVDTRRATLDLPCLFDMLTHLDDSESYYGYLQCL